MLAAPLQPSAVPEGRDLSQYRPAKDLEAFNTLLPPPIEFVEGSSSGTLAVAEGKYQAINGNGSVTPKPAKAQDLRRPSQSESEKPTSSSAQAAASSKSLYDRPIELAWPPNVTRSCGLYNSGNTCFLNSALQCLLHTPPLLNVLLRHDKTECPVKPGAFCMSCSMKELTVHCYKVSRPQMPFWITSKLNQIAKHMRKGRQEDSHEFLRYAIDALQKSCLAGYPPKIDHKLAETTWVHKIFGGRLRSRVTCLSCGYNSDTFDSILDLSIDIYNIHNLRDALRKFITVDHLRGADKYKCEKCKKPVLADKQFTIHDAPAVLTVHLKRFTPMGRKMAHPVRYEDRINLQPYMSQGQYGPSYSLYGVISHAGGGPNSGHYYAHIKDAHGRWHEMNDDSVLPQSGAPLGMKNAYILFYLKDKGQELNAAVRSVGAPISQPKKTSIVAGMKRKKAVESDDEAEDDRPPPTTPKGRFIGPLLPSPTITTKASPILNTRPDPQAEMLKKKIAEKTTLASPVKPSTALQSLSQYADDDSSDIGEKVEENVEEKLEEKIQHRSEEQTKDESESKTSAPTPSSPVTSLMPALPITPASTSKAEDSPALGPIPTSSFYASAPKRKESENDRKRKSPEADELGRYVRTPLSHTSNFDRGNRNSSDRKRFNVSNPFGGGRMQNNLHSSPMPRFGRGRRGRGRARGL